MPGAREAGQARDVHVRGSVRLPLHSSASERYFRVPEWTQMAHVADSWFWALARSRRPVGWICALAGAGPESSGPAENSSRSAARPACFRAPIGFGVVLSATARGFEVQPAVVPQGILRISHCGEVVFQVVDNTSGPRQ